MNGNLTAVSEGGVTLRYVWDDRNRLVVVQQDGVVEPLVTYAYDDDNIRVSATVGGVTTSYLLDKNRPYAQVLEEYEDGSSTVSYAYGLDLIEQERAGLETTYLVDGLGSTRALLDETGDVAAAYSYDAYGNLLGELGAVENAYRFAGEQWDEELGQYYLRQRYYDPTTGRFTRRDTWEGDNSNPITLNKHIYVHSDPVNGVDPSGLFKAMELNVVTVGLGILAAMGWGVANQGSKLNAVTELTPQQVNALTQKGFQRFIPLLRQEDDDRECWSADIPRLGAAGGETGDNVGVVAAWDYYATQVSGSNYDHLVVTPTANVTSYDGRTPGTQNVWEAKRLKESTGDFYLRVPSVFSGQLSEFQRERANGLPVASECSYNYRWAVSHQGVTDELNRQWGGIPPVVFIPET
ncbi:MAG: RHS repeat-associated core domain-containing protein [Spirulinaceae cyanobacterium SM2_1_0]|nr:RHS repeat-associated core domain-containing protein [Spirulinaceae cyanobacterium SM2_1_0]